MTEEYQFQYGEKCEWESANLFYRYSFKVADSMLAEGLKHPLQMSNLMGICKRDLSLQLSEQLKEKWKTSRKIWIIPRLIVALCRSQSIEFIAVAFYTILEGATRVASPVILGSLLVSLEEKRLGKRDAFIYAAILGGLSFAQTILHHVLFFLSMRMGWNWRSATTGLIYDHMFSLRNSDIFSTKSGTGNLVSLISNDVAVFDSFAIVSYYHNVSFE